MDHDGELVTDNEGWNFAECSCGWVSPPCPSQTEAIGFLSDHYKATATAPREDAT